MANSKHTSGLHLVPQYTYHDDAEIVGTAEALSALRDAITYALKRGVAEINTFASDGEGYPLTVRRLSDADFEKETPFYTFMETTPD